MKEYFDYIKSFSKKKKAVFYLSSIAFLYEVFTAGSLILEYFGLSDSEIFYTWIYYYLSLPAVVISQFLPFGVYVLVFPVVYFIVNIIYLRKKEYCRPVITFNFAFQLIHPATLIGFGSFIFLIMSVFGKGFFFRL